MESSPPFTPRTPLQLQRKQGSLQFSPLEFIVLGISFVIAAVAGYQIYARNSGLNDPVSAGAQSAYIPAFERSLSSTISASGTVQSTQSVSLTFGSAGKIAEVNVKAGDKVVAGQQLASLDTTQLQSALRSAQTGLASAQSKLDAVVNPSTAERATALQSVLNAENQVATAQKTLADLKAKPTSTDIATAQQGVNTALNGVQSANDAIAKAQKDVTDAQGAVNTAESDMNTAYSSLSTARSELKKAEEACTGAPSTPSLPGRGNRADSAPFVSASVTCGTSTGAAALLTSYNAAAGKYTSAANAYNTSITNVATKQAAVTTAQNSLSSGNLERSLQSAQLGLQSAYNKQTETTAGATNLEIAAAENGVRAAEAALLTAQEKYDGVISPAQDVILPLQSAVDQAAGTVATAQDNLKLATITAPFDGTVSVVNGTVGGQATATTAIMTLLNPTLIRIDANVDQTDVASLKVGQTSTATFTALTGNTYRATVSTVGLTPTTQSGVVTYVVSFAVDTASLPATAPIPAPGMTASLTVTTAQAPNALVVPARSIRGSGAAATVTVKGANGDEQRRVTTGLTNGTLTQITTGLTKGEEVLYTVTVASTTTTGNTTQPPGTQQFGGGGAVPGGGGQIPIR